MKKAIATLGAAVLLCAACTSHERILVVPTTGVRVMPDQSSVHTLAHVWCMHELDCGRVGGGGSFETLEACIDAAGLDVRSSIGLDDCPFGVVESHLNRCALTLQLDTCNDARTSISQVPQCRRTALCR